MDDEYVTVLNFGRKRQISAERISVGIMKLRKTLPIFQFSNNGGLEVRLATEELFCEYLIDQYPEDRNGGGIE